MITNYTIIPAIRWFPAIWWSPDVRWYPAIRWSIGSIDFDNPKSTVIPPSLMVLFCLISVSSKGCYIDCGKGSSPKSWYTCMSWFSGSNAVFPNLKVKESFIAYDFLLRIDAGCTHVHTHTQCHTHTYTQTHTQIGNFGNKYYRHF